MAPWILLNTGSDNSLLSNGTISLPEPMLTCSVHNIEMAGGRLNKKDGLTRYGDSHVKDKTS